jgi:predicted porin
MSKSLLSFAVLGAITGAAAAQSNNATVYGTIDGGLRYQTNTNAAGDGMITQTSGHYLANRLGFRGEEDLGGGLKALFTLESGFFVDTGAQDVAGSIFNRTAAVGIANKEHTLMLGRQYTVAYRTIGIYDPFSFRFPTLAPLISGQGTTLPGAAAAAGLGASATSGTRFNNDVQYTGTFGNLTARAEYSAGEQSGSTRPGSARAIGGNYQYAGFAVGAAYTQKYSAAGFRNTARTFGGAWSGAKLRVTAGYARETQDAAARGFGNRIVWGGAGWKFTPAFSATAAYYRTDSLSDGLEGRRELVIIGASYSFSKRTLVYGGVDKNRYEGALVPASRQTGQFGAASGIQHTF